MRAVAGVLSISVLAGASLLVLAAQAPPVPPAAPAAAGGIDAKQVGLLDLGPEIAGLQGKNLRMRMVTFPPGTRSPEHSHKDRPGLAYVLQGTFTEHRNGVATEYGPGTSWIEDHNTTHWVENRGTTPAVQLSVAIDSQQ